MRRPPDREAQGVHEAVDPKPDARAVCEPAVVADAEAAPEVVLVAIDRRNGDSATPGHLYDYLVLGSNDVGTSGDCAGRAKEGV